jgi:hypothetical protein
MEDFKKSFDWVRNFDPGYPGKYNPEYPVHRCSITLATGGLLRGYSGFTG